MNWDFPSAPVITKLVEAAVLIGLALILRKMAIRGLLHNAPKGEARRRWIVTVRNVTVMLILVIILAIWSEDIQAYATALLAFAVASVIATKEIIHCLLGGVVRTVANTYTIGDRIEIGSHRGDVVDITALTTTILEVGPGKTSHLRTGRTVVIPNSKLTDTYVINESAMKQYVVHCLTVPLSGNRDWRLAERILLAAASEECAPFIDDARRHIAELEREHGLTGLPLSPRVFVEVTAPDRISLVVRVPSRVGAQGRLEQAIVRRFLNGMPKELASASESGPGPETVLPQS